jgi:hypothetical protein
MKKAAAKKSEKPKKEKKNYYEWREKRGRGENGQVFYGSEEPPSQKKGIKKRRIMDMCLRVSRAPFSKIISERIIMDACERPIR